MAHTRPGAKHVFAMHARARQASSALLTICIVSCPLSLRETWSPWTMGTAFVIFGLTCPTVVYARPCRAGCVGGFVARVAGRPTIGARTRTAAILRSQGAATCEIGRSIVMGRLRITPKSLTSQNQGCGVGEMLNDDFKQNSVAQVFGRSREHTPETNAQILVGDTFQTCPCASSQFGQPLAKFGKR